MKIIEKLVDITTGEETITERDETNKEKDERLEAEKRLADAIQAESIANEAKKSAQAKLAALGLTTDDLKALGL